jgi:hypothetical protein
MSTMNGNHLKYMLLGGAGVFGVLLLVGVPLTSALLYAVVLACPLMMFTMGGHGGHGGAGHDHTSRGSNEPGEPIDRPSQHDHHL